VTRYSADHKQKTREAIVEAAADRKAQVIAISDSRLSPIARRADLCFEVKDAEFRKFRSLTASLCLAQTLVISYAYQLTAGDPGTAQ